MAQKLLASPVLRDDFHHVMLYAHGGMTSETHAVSVADRLWKEASGLGICPYFFIWESNWDESLFGYLKSEDDQTGPVGFSFSDAWRKVRETLGEGIEKGQMWMGKQLAPTIRTLFWNEMKGRCEGASQPKGGASLFLKELAASIKTTPNQQYKFHLVGHSAGSIFHGFLYEKPFRELMQNQPNVKLASIHFLAPAITIKRAKQAFMAAQLPADRFLVHTLSTKAENSDSIMIYPSSILTYVANHLEGSSGRRVPLLGIREHVQDSSIRFVTNVAATKSRRHVEFDEPGHEIDQVLEAIGKPW
jgi:hypothetical protein